MTERVEGKNIVALYAGDEAVLDSLMSTMNARAGIAPVFWRACSSWMEAVSLLPGLPDTPKMLIVDFTSCWGRLGDSEGYRRFLFAYADAVRQLPNKPLLGIARRPAEDQAGVLIGLGNLVDFYLAFPPVEADLQNLLFRIAQLAQARAR